jgi:sortase (surface protein transpeptidase)
MKTAPWPKLACAGVVAFLIGVSAVVAVAAPSGWLAVDGLVRFNPASGATYDWGNSGLAGPTGTCPTGAVDIGGTGGIFNCGQPGSGSAPPIAPTLTPAAAADPSIISAIFVADPISGDTTPCGSGDPTTLNGGKNGDAISSYSSSTGPVPAKTDLSNVYAVSHTRANGHPEVYFGAERLVNNGDSHMDFEFLQSVVGLTGTCSANFTGHRTEGDLLFAVDFTNGGSLAGFSVYQWHCAVDPGPQPADGTVCDPAGGPEHYELNPAPAFAALIVNSADIPCGGWVCRDQVAGNSTTVSTNDFLEGGVDLAGIPFAGCFNTFLPHTRTAQSFTSILKDFAGPIGFRSCRDPVIASTSAPTGAAVPPGTPATDTVTAGSGGAGLAPTGSISFFLCNPSQVTASGCPSGGAQVGAAKAFAAGVATSDPTASAGSAGKYCWRTEYAPDAASTGIYAPATHTNATTECFNVAVVASLPNTGVPAIPLEPQLSFQALIAVPITLLAFAWRRRRSVAVLMIAGVIAGCSPPAHATSLSPGVAIDQLHHETGDLLTSSAQQLSTETAKAMGWRLVIPRIGVDARIERVGLDPHGAMASPSSLDSVGWFNQGPVPGQPGDAVIAGHFGLPREPAVFRDLGALRTGDAVQVVWPDGRTVDFRVASSETVPASAHPSGVFGDAAPARLSLITCGGAWLQSQATYSERLIVTAVPA